MKKRFTLLLALLAFAGWILWANTALMITEIEVADPSFPASFSGLRIAQISDLHDASFGEKNKQLIALLNDCAPDFIVITGDMVDARRTDLNAALEFACEAVKIAPCYYVTGNHESAIAQQDELMEGLARAGVTVLADQKVTLERQGEKIVLIGLNDPAFSSREQLRRHLEALSEPEEYQILLAHRPELIELYAQSGVNLVFSGHAHGGQFRIPFLGGVYAPGQGFFPQYDAGLYTVEETTLVVSRGLGNSSFPLRFYNRPEVVVVTLRGEN